MPVWILSYSNVCFRKIWHSEKFPASLIKSTKSHTCVNSQLFQCLFSTICQNKSFPSSLIKPQKIMPAWILSYYNVCFRVLAQEDISSLFDLVLKKSCIFEPSTIQMFVFLHLALQDIFLPLCQTLKHSCLFEILAFPMFSFQYLALQEISSLFD